MSAVDEIEAAIAKLSGLRDQSDGEQWYVGSEYGTSGNRMRVAELIVTLHRTIDAQLAILEDFQWRYRKVLDPAFMPISPMGIAALNLARAINGTTEGAVE